MWKQSLVIVALEQTKFLCKLLGPNNFICLPLTIIQPALLSGFLLFIYVYIFLSIKCPVLYFYYVY